MLIRVNGVLFYAIKSNYEHVNSLIYRKMLDEFEGFHGFGKICELFVGDKFALLPKGTNLHLSTFPLKTL